MLEVEDVHVHYPGAALPSLRGVSLRLEGRETLGIVGASGSGKSTLARVAVGLLPPTRGLVRVAGAPLARPGTTAFRTQRRLVQLVFQDASAALNPRLTIARALLEPIRLHASTWTVESLLDRVGLSRHSMQRLPHELSGGQRQRVVLARALAVGPRVLVCDESVSALDVSVQAQVLNLLQDLQRDLGLAMVFISHDLPVVRWMSQRLIVLDAGRIAEEGPADEVMTQPQSDTTRALLAALPGLASAH